MDIFLAATAIPTFITSVLSSSLNLTFIPVFAEVSTALLGALHDTHLDWARAVVARPRVTCLALRAWMSEGLPDESSWSAFALLRASE